MTVEEEKLLRQMVENKAYILLEDFGDMYPVHAGGNRRSRPKRWVDKAMFKRLLYAGWLVHEGPGARVSDSLQIRLTAPNLDTAHAAQHRDMRSDTVYIQEGVKRSVSRNSNVSVLERLSRLRDPQGRLRLSAAEVEAGKQFARDYDLSGMGFVSTQNFENVRVDITKKQDGGENALIHNLDRRKRVSEAISCLGPGLDRALISVCCENWSTTQLERTEKWARNSGITVLKLALARLALFYGTHTGEAAVRSSKF